MRSKPDWMQHLMLVSATLVAPVLAIAQTPTPAPTPTPSCVIQGVICGNELQNPPEYIGNPTKPTPTPSPKTARKQAKTSSATPVPSPVPTPVPAPAAGLTFSTSTVNMPGFAGSNGPITVSVNTRNFSNSGSTLLAGPTMRVSPGQALSILLNNQLTYTEGDNPKNHHVPMNKMPVADTTPHGFDVLNLHTHGMHVSPKGHSDNVLLNLFPSDSPKHTVHHCQQQLVGDPITKADCAQGQWPMLVNLPNQHPSGTYWYHTHKHGAVALHLASGLSGALIVQDYQNGLESLPQVASLVGTANEKVMLLQQIAFGPSSPAPAPSPAASCTPAPAPLCPTPTPTPAPAPAPPPPSGTQYVNCWGVYNHPISCKYDTQFVVSTSTNTQFSVNGQFNPVITMQQGQPQLWRMVNTTPAQVMPVCLVPLTGTSAAPPALYVLAADGTPVQIKHAPSGSLAFQLTTPVSNVVENPLGLANNEFQFLAPGQRLDLLVQPSSQGQFVLWSAQSVTQLGQLCPTSLSPSQLGALQSNVVAFVNVTANSGTPPANPIPSQAQLNQLYNPTSVHGHRHTPTAPTQGVVFGFTNASYTPTDKNCPINSKVNGASVVNGRPFYEGRIQRRLQLNQADMWGVQSAVDTHMFHIHTNPFQMVTRGNVKYPFPIWRDTALINCSPVASGNNNCAFLAGLTSQFVDSNGNPSGSYGEVVQFVSRAVDFTGPIVMHCHNTEHEDNGMMELVEITDAKGDSSAAKPAGKHKH